MFAKALTSYNPSSWAIKPNALRHQHCNTRERVIAWRPNLIGHFHGSDTHLVVAVQLLSHVRLFAAPQTAAHQASLSIAIAWTLLKLMSTESVMPSKHLASVALSSRLNLSQLQGFLQWVSSSHQVAKVLDHVHSQIVPGDFPGGPVVKNLPCSAGNRGRPLVRELRSYMLQSYWACTPQLESSCTAVKIPCATTKTQCGQIKF